MIRFLINGQPASASSAVTVASLVDAVGRDRRGIAVAVNDAVVPRSQWDATAVFDGDRVEILTAAQGG